jgi:hypothetical protein
MWILMLSQNRHFLPSLVLRGFVLLVWVLGVPGLRPVYHHHLDESVSESELGQLAEHLRIYKHQDPSDTAKIHLHWLVELDGQSLRAFPNSPLAMANPIAKSLAQTTDPVEVGTGALFDFEPRADGVWQSLVYASVRPEPHGLPLEFCESKAAEHTRRTAYSTTRYFAACL